MIVTDYAVTGEAMLEAKNWKIALERYDGHPIPALLLAHQLMAIKQCHQLYMRRLEGTLKPKEEEKLRQQGVKL